MNRKMISRQDTAYYSGDGTNDLHIIPSYLVSWFQAENPSYKSVTRIKFNRN